jgi:hypothetical protein
MKSRGFAFTGNSETVNVVRHVILAGVASGERSRRRLEQHASRTLLALESHQETGEESDVCSEGVEQKNEI